MTPRYEASARHPRPADGFRSGNAPGRTPVVGHLPQLVRNPWPFLASLPRYGDLVTVMIGPRALHMVCDPDLLHQVLVDDRTFDKGGPLFDKAREVLGDGLPVCPHAQHRRLRRLVQPAFHPTRMPGYSALMGEQITEVIDGWQDGQVIDALSAAHEIATGIATSTMFSTRLDAATLAEARQCVAITMAGIYRRLLTPTALERLPTPANRAYDRARARLHHIVDQIIDEPGRDRTDHGDLLSILLAAGSSGTDGMTPQEMTDQVVSFFISGITSVASALAWTLHLITDRPEIAERLQAESDTVLAGRIATHDDLPRLDLARRFVTETLRLYPPGWIFTRRVSADTHLAGRRLAAGTVLAYSPYLLHRRPDLFAHPERFDPDRWLPERAASIAQHAYVPFGAGPRKCIGEAFTLAQATLVLTSITACWHLRPVAGQTVRPALRATLIPQRLQLEVDSRRT
ncbi:cytochrome P450 [Streptomyces sp. DG2A-72]|uniref:cytochrome P450 n=1 Tax=Streptomyces sp. DG2A-72 TaxID=3051386 RepID=UPI00265B8E34|nr:cytochrome P450 [Streptomyces sp. DG2A-72]MDO0936491.1 cytochrome P450 [Streptomyces sp. DG2A-72]